MRSADTMSSQLVQGQLINIPISQDEINSILWRACDTFRGTVDPSEYKNYILRRLLPCMGRGITASFPRGRISRRVAGEQQGKTERRVRVIAWGVFDQRWRLQEEFLVTQ